MNRCAWGAERSTAVGRSAWSGSAGLRSRRSVWPEVGEIASTVGITLLIVAGVALVGGVVWLVWSEIALIGSGSSWPAVRSNQPSRWGCGHDRGQQRSGVRAASRVDLRRLRLRLGTRWSAVDRGASAGAIGGMPGVRGLALARRVGRGGWPVMTAQTVDRVATPDIESADEDRVELGTKVRGLAVRLGTATIRQLVMIWRYTWTVYALVRLGLLWRSFCAQHRPGYPAHPHRPRPAAGRRAPGAQARPLSGSARTAGPCGYGCGPASTSATTPRPA